ncbi:MAG: phosphate ABC transporter permease subunit PstC [Actinomycetota bacterium]|nr:phosphate ABC transporter permease subunit PstC [Actinomycetota bacterium]
MSSEARLQPAETGGQSGRRAEKGTGGRLVRLVTGSAAWLPLLALLFVVVSLVVEALPAIRVNGIHFLTGVAWSFGNAYGAVVKTHGVPHPQGASYGALPLIVGTLASSAIALLIAVPVSVLSALVLVERLPRSISSLVGLFLETLAGIPSVVFGLWGALTLGPVLAHHVYPALASVASAVPGLGYFGGYTGNGEGLATSGVVLAVMILPIVAATARDLFRQVPDLPKEGARALGMTEWEVATRVTLTWVRSGLIGASVLGLARALGETMAVAMVSGVELGAIPHNVYAAMSTVAATIVSQLDSAFTDSTGFAVKTLAEAGLLLAALTLLTNVVARVLVRRVASTALPVGRGV